MAVLNYITDKKDLEKTLNDILEKVINNVADKLLKDFRRHLDNTVYSPPENRYERYGSNGGFYSGWEIEKAHKYVRSLIFNPSNLIHPSKDTRNDFYETGLAHGGNSPGNKDYRSDMPWILNDITSNNNYSRSGGARYLDNTNIGYWDSYMRDIDDKVTKWLDDEFKKYGITRG